MTSLENAQWQGFVRWSIMADGFTADEYFDEAVVMVMGFASGVVVVWVRGFMGESTMAWVKGFAGMVAMAWVKCFIEESTTTWVKDFAGGFLYKYILSSFPSFFTGCRQSQCNPPWFVFCLARAEHGSQRVAIRDPILTQS